jgi:hypothetical protein
VRRLAALCAALAIPLATAGPAAAAAAPTPGSNAPATTTTAALSDPNALTSPPSLLSPPTGHRLTGKKAQAIADRVAKIRAARKKYPGSYSSVFLKGTSRWQVSYYSRDKPPKEIGQVIIDDYSAGVLEAWTGYQVPWTMARGYPGAFGRKVNSPWVWIPLTILFIAPFATPLRPRRMLHLDLLVLAAFGISVAYFNDARIGVSVPFVYPLLAYLLARMLWIGLRTRPERDRVARGPLPLLVPASWLAVGLVFLLGFRVGLNITSSNVIDVGYAGVIGAHKIVHGEPLYGTFPKDNEHGDTYGPVNYEAYVPFVQAFGWSGRWDDLPAAHAAAIVFDLLCIGLLFLIGFRWRGPTLGVALAYAWAAYPFTLYAANCNANDSLVAVFVLLAIAVAGSAPARGAAAALGGLTKFASLGIAPLLATHGAPRNRRRSVASFALVFVGVALLAMTPVVAQGESLQTMYDRSVGFQAQRGSPFSIWGLYDLPFLQHAWQVIAVLLALGLALVPRRRDLVGLAACVAAVLIALQAGVTHWFYLYVVWFFPVVMIALLGRFAETPAAPGPARLAT